MIAAAFGTEIQDTFVSHAVSKMPSGGVIKKLGKAKITGHAAMCREILAKAGLSANIAVTAKKFLAHHHHVICPADYVSALAAAGKLENLTGGQPLQPALLRFWELFASWRPDHPALANGVEACAFSVPILLFGDEGRALKKQAAMVLGWEPMLGYGCLNDCHDDPEPLHGHMLNMDGSTYKTRVLYTIMHKKSYGKKSEVLLELIQSWAADHAAAMEGVQVIYQDASVSVKLVPMGVKSDWAAMAKLGQLERSFYHDSTPFGKGICHLCLGNTETCHEWTTETWKDTMGDLYFPPWSVEPALVQWLCTGYENDWEKAAFFRLDLFHICHKGTMAELAGSGLATMKHITEACSIFIVNNLLYSYHENGSSKLSSEASAFAFHHLRLHSSTQICMVLRDPLKLSSHSSSKT